MQLANLHCLPYNQIVPPTKRAPKAERTDTLEVISFRVPAELAEATRDACYWARIKFVDFARTALEREVQRLEKAHNSGKPFEARPNK